MLDIYAFVDEKTRIAKDNHSVVVTDQASGVAVVIVRQTGGMTEVLVPGDAEFNSTLALLAAVSKAPIRSPSEVKVEKS